MLKRNKDPERNQIGLKTPSLHGNNSEFGANEVNSILFWIITCPSMRHTVCQSINYISYVASALKFTAESA